MEKYGLALLGFDEKIITWGTLLARRGVSLEAFFMPEHSWALEGSILMGCPAYSQLSDFVKRAKIIMVENGDDTICNACKKLEDKLIVVISFVNSLTENPKDDKFFLPVTKNVIYLNIIGQLPKIGEYICQVDNYLDGLHEPNPQSDYNLSLSSLQFTINGCNLESFLNDTTNTDWAEPLRKVLKQIFKTSDTSSKVLG
ncbi:hypothetical protein IJT10_00565 [bacterium]|nr:hypothetical protein [bacterium]